LIGFVDAEGNFQTTIVKRKNKKGIITSLGLKYSFHLSLHLRDINLIKLIHEKLEKRGTIYIYNNEKRQEVHLAITKIIDLKWLIDNIFEKYTLVTKHQILRYEKLKLGIINNIKNLNDLNQFEPINISIPDVSNCSQNYINNWIVGFLNGEIAFTKSKKYNKEIPVIFLEHTDFKAMELVKNILKLSPNILSRNRENRKTTHYLSISSKNDIQNIVKFFDSMNILLGYKLVQYEEWKTKFQL
jgi:LAGLIDADG endonuclease